MTDYEPKSCEFFCLFNFYLLKDSTHPLLLLSPWSFPTNSERIAGCWSVPVEVLGWLSVPCGSAGFAWWFCWRCLGALVSLSLGVDSVGVHWKVVLVVSVGFLWF